MNEVQRAALDRAAATIRPAMDLYEQRNRIACHLYKLLDVDQLRELADLLDRLSDDDLQQALEFVRGLAAWGSPAAESPDAAIAQPGSAAAGGTGG